jgi:ABC-2 type transport system permease protein
MNDPRRPAPFARMFAFEAASELLRAVRTPSFALPTLLFPIGLYTLFAFVLPGDGASLYLLATFGIIGAIGPAIFGFGVSVATERQSGWLDIKRLSPLSAAGFLAAKLAMCLVFALVILGALYVLAASIGGVRLETRQWAMLSAAHLLSAPPMGLLGLALGLRLPPQGAAGVVNVVFLALAALGGLWAPIAMLPEPMQMFARALPTYHMAELSLIIAGARNSDPLIHLAALCGFTLVFAFLAARGWSRVAAR